MFSRVVSRNTSVYNAFKNSFSQVKSVPVMVQARLCSNEPAVKNEAEKPPPYRGVPKHQVRPIDRFFLVATRAYKRFDDVPTEVDQSTIAKAQNIRRISISILLCIGTAVGSYIAFKRGKYVIENKLEDNLTMRNLKRDERNRAKSAQDRADKAAAAAAEAASKPVAE